MSYQIVTPAGAKALLESDPQAVCIDVRSVPEHQAEHIHGAYNVPIFERDPIGRMSPTHDFVEVLERHFDKQRPLVLACEIGKRSDMACQVLAAAGFTNLHNMHGGFRGYPEPDGSISEPGWQSCGFPTAIESLEGRTYSELSGE